MGKAAGLTLTAFTLANATYGVFARLVISVLKAFCGGVPIITFFDAYDYDHEQPKDRDQDQDQDPLN